MGLFPKSSSYSLKRVKRNFIIYIQILSLLPISMEGNDSCTLLYVATAERHLTKRHTDVLTNDACVKRRTALIDVYFANVPVCA